MRTMEGTPLTVETFEYSPAELVELGIAGVREASIDYLEERITKEKISCPNPYCDVAQIPVAETDKRWRLCPSCLVLWTIDEWMGLVYIRVQE